MQRVTGCTHTLAPSSQGSNMTHKSSECGLTGDLAGLPRLVGQLGKPRPEERRKLVQSRMAPPAVGLVPRGLPRTPCPALLLPSWM